MNKTFEEAKEETYSVFDDRCRELLDDFLKAKSEAVCVKCSESESCSDGNKIHRALRNLIEELTTEAAKRCANEVDFFVCLLCPHLSSANLVRSMAEGKRMKSLAREMEKSGDRLFAIVKGGENG